MQYYKIIIIIVNPILTNSWSPGVDCASWSSYLHVQHRLATCLCGGVSQAATQPTTHFVSSPLYVWQHWWHWTPTIRGLDLEFTS